MPQLPETGYLRLGQIIGDRESDPPQPAIIPVGKSTWWAGVASGRFPRPVKLSARVTAWRVEDVRALMKKIDARTLVLLVVLLPAVFTISIASFTLRPYTMVGRARIGTDLGPEQIHACVATKFVSVVAPGPPRPLARSIPAPRIKGRNGATQRDGRSALGLTEACPECQTALDDFDRPVARHDYSVAKAAWARAVQAAKIFRDTSRQA
jgi:hypothetical protein